MMIAQLLLMMFEVFICIGSLTCSIIQCIPKKNKRDNRSTKEKKHIDNDFSDTNDK